VDDLKRAAPVAEDETKITLGLLNAIEANSAVTQRSVASDLGIALGLANAYLKRCARTGLIKVQQVPANRYAYYLTPKGFAEKSRLTAEYLTISFNFFRNARSACSDVFDECLARGRRRIALAGVGDLGEIATLCASDTLVTLVGFYDPDSDHRRFAGLKVVDRLDDLPAFDAIVVTDFRRPQETFDRLVAQIGPDRVFAPELLRVSRERPNMVE
jgi:DNA-binding MarR family transcriptional regulator